MTFGNICLNLSTLLYLIVYLPQLKHNRQTENLSHLSLLMHVFLFSGYMLDFLYGLLTHLPWQYITVSTFGLVLLMIQHSQMTRYFSHIIQNNPQKDESERPRLARYPIAIWTCKPSSIRAKRLLNALILISLTIFVLVIVKQSDISQQQATLLGWISRLFFILCFIPQLVKNYITKTNHALSRYYLGTHITINCLDFISAWSLAWGWPNKIGPIVSLMLLTLLLCKKPSTNINRSHHASGIG